MVTSNDYYETLGIKRDASYEDIKRAFRKQALKYHPDRSTEPDAEKRFKEINEAYHVVNNPKTREIYDRYGKDGLKSQTHGSPGFDFSSFGDIFSEMFGMGRRQRQKNPNQANDLQYEIQLDLMDVAKGTKQKIQFKSPVLCPKCKGRRTSSKSDPHTCSDCGGSGEVITSRRASFFEFQSSTSCPRCRGEGVEVSDPCKNCNAKGKVVGTRKVEFEVPAGIEDGTNICLKGEGEPAANGAQSGDLYVLLRVKKHPLFERQGRDIYAPLELNFAQVALGGEVVVSSLTNKHKLKVPPGTEHGAVLKVKEAGLPTPGNPYKKGDLYMVIRVKSPKKLSKDERKMFEKLLETL